MHINEIKENASDASMSSDPACYTLSIYIPIVYKIINAFNAQKKNFINSTLLISRYFDQHFFFGQLTA